MKELRVDNRADMKTSIKTGEGKQQIKNRHRTEQMATCKYVSKAWPERFHLRKKTKLMLQFQKRIINYSTSEKSIIESINSAKRRKSRNRNRPYS